MFTLLMILKILVFLLKHILLSYIWTDPKTESRRGRIYIPRDELHHTDESLIFSQEFNTFEDVLSLFGIEIKHDTDILSKFNKTSRANVLSPTNARSVAKTSTYPTPQVIAGIYIG